MNIHDVDAYTHEQINSQPIHFAHWAVIRDDDDGAVTENCITQSCKESDRHAPISTRGKSKREREEEMCNGATYRL